MSPSALYSGTVYHERFRPTQHRFSYQIHLFWLNLDELERLESSVKHFSFMHRALVQFRSTDYLGIHNGNVKQAVLNKIVQLGGPSFKPAASDNGTADMQPACEVCMLGQLRTFGMYFSPVNFYFVRPAGASVFTYMLAEVSNTPWHERHYYLVDMATQDDTQKAFHVSPFNPMDMTYKWRISQPAAKFAMTMDCHQQERDFSAGLQLHRAPLTSQSLKAALFKIPSMTVKTVTGIYWQALKLWLKRTPIYSHPNN